MTKTQDTNSAWRMITLPIKIHASTFLSDGTIITCFKDTILSSQGAGMTSLALKAFDEIYKFDSSSVPSKQRLYSDKNDSIYYSSYSVKALYRSIDKGLTFKPVIANLGGTLRGFAQDTSGTIFAGSYLKKGPAQLFASVDGVNWNVAHQWNARHIHNVRVNPYNNWLYIVVGEGDHQQTEESHAIYRSKNGGKTFARIVSAHNRRPLFTSINFNNNEVILGTDHFEGNNFIGVFTDTGKDMNFPVVPIHSLSPLVDQMKVSPFYYFLEWLGQTLFAGVRGSGLAGLIATTDLKNWQIVHMTTAIDSVSYGCIDASVMANGSALVVSGIPGLLITNAVEQKSSGLWVPELAGNHTDGVLSSTLNQAHEEENVTVEPKKPEVGLSHFEGLWGLPIEQRIQEVLLEIDTRYESEISKGYFYRANPFFFNKIHLRETLIELLHLNFDKQARVLDYGCGTGQFLFFLSQFGFTNLHGWDQNERWLVAGRELFKRLSSEDFCTFKRVERPSIYNLVSVTGKPFDVIVMFGLIYGHGIEIDKIFRSVAEALNKGGMFVANDGKHNAKEMEKYIHEPGLELRRRITVYNAQGREENHIYFCSK